MESKPKLNKRTCLFIRYLRVNVKDFCGNLAFNFACALGKTKIVELLINEPVWDTKDSIRTRISDPTKQRNKSYIDFNSKDCGGWTGFQRACANGLSAVVDLILRNYIKMNIDLNLSHLLLLGIALRLRP